MPIEEKNDKGEVISTTYNCLVHLKRVDNNCVYPFGIDPAWYRSNEEVSFMNSFKMKCAVILGVS